ncbi:MAG: DUF6265 family protein [Planctomycetota bacterium]|nr:DUF6265 family protein [Planctomycetota bacterium]
MIATVLLLTASPAPISPQEVVGPDAAAVADAARVAGLSFTPEELALMMPDVLERMAAFDELRSTTLANGVAPAMIFSPWIPGVEPRASQHVVPMPALPDIARPADLEDAAFWSIAELAALLRETDVTSVELTEMYLSRLERLDAQLHCVITFTRERALQRAERADALFAEGTDLGLLQGIPWGVKDLMACEGYRTTWGAKPFEEQMIDETAEVIERLDAAGAVLVAKLSVGALAWGDVWFGERTRSPWDTSRGSSGSSAGSASATAAGGVAFAIGTETLGSIVSPSVACSTSALRPTFGRVSRRGTMALCWSMDKIGPITRTLDDAAIVFDAIEGRDPKDAFSRDGRVPVDLESLAEAGPMTIGVPAGAFRGADELKGVRAELAAMGHEVVELELPELPVEGMLLTLGVEAATAFDEFTRSGRDDELTRQVRNAWPNVFRVARSVPGVEFLRAQRLRSLAMVALDRALRDVDVIVHGPYGAGVLQLTNLTGHPTVAAPFVPEAGPRRDGSPYTVCFTGHLDCDEQLLSIARSWQNAHPGHVRHPPLGWLAPRGPDLPANAASAAVLERLSFMEGRWVAVKPDGTIDEEVWTSPRGDALVGSFRQVRPDRGPELVEQARIAVEEAGTVLRLRHLHGRRGDPESRENASVLQLVSIDEGRVEFRGAAEAMGVTTVVYERADPVTLLLSIGFDPSTGEEPIVTRYRLDGGADADRGADEEEGK